MVQTQTEQIAPLGWKPIRWPPEDYQPLHHQYDMHLSPARFRWLCSGIGGGKTAWAVLEDFDWAIRYPGSTGAIIVPDFRTWRHVVKLEAEKWWPGHGTIWKETKPNELVEVYCGSGVTSKIMIYSASNAEHVRKILGTNLTWFHIEEAGRMLHGEAAWRNATGRLRQKSPRRGGWVSGSPFGFGWLTDAFGIDTALPPTAYTHGILTKQQKDPKTGVVTDYYVRGAQTDWNIHNPPDYYPSLLSVYGGDARFVEQELHGGIISQSDLIFYGWYPVLHVIPHQAALKLFDRCPHHHGGVDWGDRVAAMTWGGTTAGGWEHGDVVTIGELYGEHLSAEQMGAHACYINRSYGGFRWYCDPAEPGEIRKWRTTGFRFGDNHYPDGVEGTVLPSTIPGKKWNQWLVGINSMRTLMGFERNRDHPAYPKGNRLGGARWYVSEKCTNLINELRDYKWAPVQVGTRERRENAIGAHHAIDTCRYRVLGEQMMALGDYGPGEAKNPVRQR